MSDMRRRLLALEAQLAVLERLAPSACCPACRLPMSGEDRERVLREARGEPMRLYTEGDEIPSRFCDACRMRQALDAMRLAFDDGGLTGEVEVLAAPAGGPWEEGDQ